MNDDDYIELIAFVGRQLVEAGAAELADPALYTARDLETGEYRAIEPRKRLIEMLEAFERHLSVRDLAVFEKSLFSLNQALEGNGIEGVEISGVAEDGREESSIDFRGAPALSELRRRVRRLIAQILES